MSGQEEPFENATAFKNTHRNAAVTKKLFISRVGRFNDEAFKGSISLSWPLVSPEHPATHQPLPVPCWSAMCFGGLGIFICSVCLCWCLSYCKQPEEAVPPKIQSPSAAASALPPEINGGALGEPSARTDNNSDDIEVGGTKEHVLSSRSCPT